MATKWQKTKIKIPMAYSPAEREAIAQEVLDFIRERVQGKNLDKRNRPLPSYSKSYVNSLAFKIAGKSKNDVNMTQSGDTLAAMQLLDHKPGEIVIGWERGSKENAIADGNIRGTYGNSRSVGPKRDFLGLAQKDLAKILKQEFPLDDQKKRMESVAAHKGGEAAKDGFDGDEGGED